MLHSIRASNAVVRSGALRQHGLRYTSAFLQSPISPVQLSQWGDQYLKSSSDERAAHQQQLLKEDPHFSSTGKMLKASKTGLQLALSLREDIKSCQKKSADVDDLKPKWKQFDKYLKNWLGVVFCESMLELRQVQFENTSDEALKYIVDTEAVHPITNVEGLKHRFGDGRRCYALFLSQSAAACGYSLPLAYIHVGLTESYSNSLQAVLDGTEVAEPQYAIFYSVNSPHPALSGLDLASSLIKRVCGDLAQRYPSLHTYSTLSPVPAFCHWAKTVMRSIESADFCSDPNPKMTALVQSLPAEVDFIAITRLLNTFNKGKLHREQLQEKELYVEKSEHQGDILQVLLKMFEVLVIQSAVKTASPAECEQWMLDFKRLRSNSQFVLLSDHLVLHYLAAEKMPPKGAGMDKLQLPLDPVARFHVRNGAALRRLNCLGSPAPYGITNSSTYMVNYLYFAREAGDRVTGDTIVTAQDEAISAFVNSGGHVPVHSSITNYSSV